MFVLAAPALADADVGVVNAERAAVGLPPVVEDGGLTSLAQQQAARMAATGNLVHSTDLGGAVGSVLPAYTGAAENVGEGSSIATVANLFMQSPSHRSAILGDFDTAGVGVARSSDGRIWVAELFARSGGRVLSHTVTRPAVTRSTCRKVTRRVHGRRVTRCLKRKAKRRAARAVRRHRRR